MPVDCASECGCDLREFVVFRRTQVSPTKFPLKVDDGARRELSGDRIGEHEERRPIPNYREQTNHLGYVTAN
jgi:hypothetical protein